MFPKFANKSAAAPSARPAATPPAISARPALPTLPSSAATAPARPAAPAAAAAPASPTAPAAPATVTRPATPLAQNLQAAVGTMPTRVAGQGFPSFVPRAASAPPTPPPAATSTSHLNHLAQSLKSAAAPPALAKAAPLPRPPQSPAPAAPRATPLAGLRLPAAAPQPQLQTLTSTRAAQPQKLVAMKSFRDRLARAQANAAQARNAVVLKPAVGQSTPMPAQARTAPSPPGLSRPTHRNEPPRGEAPAASAKLLAVPAPRPEPKPMTDSRPPVARLATTQVAPRPTTPAGNAAPATTTAAAGAATSAASKTTRPAAAVAQVTTPVAPSALRPTTESEPRVESRLDKKVASAPTPSPVSQASSPSVTLPTQAHPTGSGLATTPPSRSEDSPRGETEPRKLNSQKVAALESASARPLLREELAREVALPKRPLEQQATPASHSSEGDGGSGQGGGGGGHQQGGSGGGSGGQGRGGQGNEDMQLDLDWLGGGDELLAFSSDLRDLQLQSRARSGAELEVPAGSARRRHQEQEEGQQPPPRHQRRRQWDEEADDNSAEQAPADRNDCSPAALVCRPDVEFVSTARLWLERCELRHYTTVCPGEVDSLGIFRLRDFARFETTHRLFVA